MTGRALIAVLQIVTLSRILDPADFKLVALALTIINIGIVFSDMGISNALIRFREVSETERVTLFWLNIGMGATATILTAAISPGIAIFYSDARLLSLVLLASTVFIITSAGQQHRALAEKALRFDKLFRVDIISAVAGFFIAVALALFGFGATSIILGYIVNAVVGSILAWVLLSDGFRLSFTFDLQAAKRFLSFGGNVVGIQICNAIALNGDVILGGRYITGPALGYYFQPRDLCLRIMFVVNPIVTRVSFPLLASVAHDQTRVRSIYLKAMNMTASINFPIYIFLALFGNEVVDLVLGAKWAASGPLMRLVALWCAARSVGNPVGSLLLATGHTRRALISAFSVSIGVFAFTVAGAQYGVTGIPMAMTALYAILIPIFWFWLIRPACGAQCWEYHRVLLLPAIATMCAAGVAFLVTLPVNGTLPRIASGGLAGGISYIAASYLINRSWLHSMIELLMIQKLRNWLFNRFV